MKQSLKKIDVENVFAGGKIFKTPAFLLRFKISAEPSARIGFVFSRHSGTSVERHTFKRRFRELLRLEGDSSYLHLVVQPRKRLSLIMRAEWLREKALVQQFLAKTKKQNQKLVDPS